MECKFANVNQLTNFPRVSQASSTSFHIFLYHLANMARGLPYAAFIIITCIISLIISWLSPFS